MVEQSGLTRTAFCVAHRRAIRLQTFVSFLRLHYATCYVHPDTKARIYAAAKELGYHPNIMAQALRQGRRHTIGVVVPRLHLTIFSEILQGIEREAGQLGYATLICTTDDDPKTEKDCLNRLRNGFVDGIIIAGTGRNGRILRDIQASGVALVQLVRRQEGQISSVVADYKECGEDAARFLYRKGCRKLGLISGSDDLAPYRERYEGFWRAMRELNLEAFYCACNRPVNTFEYGYDCTNRLLDDHPDLDAILAAVDVQGLGAIRAVTERGLKIPDQIKVISLTGHEVGAMLQTAMTSMEMPARLMGQKAARMVVEEIEAPDTGKQAPQHLCFTMQLEEREST